MIQQNTYCVQLYELSRLFFRSLAKHSPSISIGSKGQWSWLRANSFRLDNSSYLTILNVDQAPIQLYKMRHYYIIELLIILNSFL